MAIDQVQVVMAKRKPNWSESELFALSDAVDLTFQSSVVYIYWHNLFDQGNLTIVYIVPQNRNK
jgi:putative AlgH/UPF0301 family transcriptional regulator